MDVQKAIETKAKIHSRGSLSLYNTARHWRLCLRPAIMLDIWQALRLGWH